MLPSIHANEGEKMHEENKKNQGFRYDHYTRMIVEYINSEMYA
jgi:hypothetical protein